MKKNKTNSYNNDRQQPANHDKLICLKHKKCIRHEDNAKEKLRKLKLAKEFINDLEQHGPCGLVHIIVLSNILKTPIKIWTSINKLNRIIGTHKTRSPIDIEYHESQSDVGHWTLKGNQEPTNIETHLNGCLFTVVASQVVRTPADLRADTIQSLKKNVKTLANRIDKILWLNTNHKSSLMIGGARYNGTSARSAAMILDKSQNVLCHECRYTGHPRGHASHKSATGPNDSVENYSRTTASRKSGFLSRDEQNTVAHIALSHRKAQQAMEFLNRGAPSRALDLTARELENSKYTLPKMKEYYNGEENSSEISIVRVTLVLRHHQGESSNSNADVFVHTFYPRAS